ncbi:hypothetical protein HU200_057500 [Digitaria exilis]|uniref:F-box associated beta-propeller type 3 domain-containing protein n=1 Tax=Digitaria exilis TaxID=1010633 RepID=A0A835AB59_9POAL|nr:hypothetical protein HU200_057500 [Digitaria exilis]
MATEMGRRVLKKKSADLTPCHVMLPDHLVVEVLVRLLARSLARFRCACRSWDAEISSRAFQERHHALAAGQFLLLQSAPPHIAYLQMYVGRARPAQQIAVNCKDCPGVIGSKPCFGLVLVRRPCQEPLSVCNPTTGEVLQLPPLHQKFCVAGIGFHASAGEFKVVKVGVQLGTVKATVLTVGDAQGWRGESIDTNLEPVFADGCLHWIFRTEYLDKPHGILSFSLADESFRRVAHPSFSTADLLPFSHNRDQQHVCQRWRAAGGVRSGSGETVTVPVGTTLAELDGRLCMMRDVRHRSDVGGLLFEIWKLQDYEMGSWSLDYRVDMAPGHSTERLKTPWLVVPLRYLDGGGSRQGAKRKLLLATTMREAHVYDPGSGTLETVASIAGGGSGDLEDNSLRLVLYQESLVRFTAMKQGKGEIEFVKI